MDTLITFIDNNFSISGKNIPEVFSNGIVAVTSGDKDPIGPTGVFEGLIPTVAMVIGTVVSLLIVFWLLSYFIYFPVKDIVKKREDKIKSDLTTAEKLNSEASNSLKRAQNSIKTSKHEASDIVAKSVDDASLIKNEIINDAKLKAGGIIEQARSQIVHEQKEASLQINDEIANVAMLAATKIIEKEIDSKTNKKLIDDLINDLGK